MLFGFGEKGLTAHRFVHNTLEEPINVIPTESVYKMHWTKGGEEKSVTLWRDSEKYFEELLKAFPGTDEQIKISQFFGRQSGFHELNS